jgi:uncharacterized membrane protein (UPF0136 family)
MRTVALYEMLFGIFSITLGILGYTQSDSVVSLVAGGTAGVVLIFAALGMQKGSRTGMYLALVISLLLLGRFSYQLIAQDAPFYPAGAMVIPSAISLLLIAMLLVQPKERKRIF